jgi:hypothetical protein
MQTIPKSENREMPPLAVILSCARCHTVGAVVSGGKKIKCEQCGHTMRQLWGAQC